MWNRHSTSNYTVNKPLMRTTTHRSQKRIKIFRRVQTRQECRTLQEDLNRLEQWSAKWQMLFNQSKCKCLHIGRANGKEPYEMHNTVLLKTSKEKDLGMTISADWKVSEQCGIAATRMIKRNITCTEKT